MYEKKGKSNNGKGIEVLILLYKLIFCCLNLVGSVPVHATKKANHLFDWLF